MKIEMVRGYVQPYRIIPRSIKEQTRFERGVVNKVLRDERELYRAINTKKKATYITSVCQCVLCFGHRMV